MTEDAAWKYAEGLSGSAEREYAMRAVCAFTHCEEPPVSGAISQQAQAALRVRIRLLLAGKVRPGDYSNGSEKWKGTP